MRGFSLAEFYTRGVNRYGGMAIGAPALAALEESVVRWIAGDICGRAPSCWSVRPAPPTRGRSTRCRPWPSCRGVRGSGSTWTRPTAASSGSPSVDATGWPAPSGPTRSPWIPTRRCSCPSAPAPSSYGTRPRSPPAHEGTGNYLQDAGSGDGLPNYAQLGPELTRENRGLRAWLPLHLHGVAAFRAALDEKLDLAEQVHDKLATVSSLELPWRPDLSTVAFRVCPRNGDVAGADRATRRLLDRVNAERRVLLSSTVVEGRQTLRVCVVIHRTHGDRVAEALDLIIAAAAAE